MNIRMTSLHSSIPFMATLLFLALSALCQIIQGRKLNIERQFHQYRAMLKSENRTVFPDMDIRSLLNPGLRRRGPVRIKPSKLHLQHSRQQSGNNNPLSQFPTSSSEFDSSSFPSKTGSLRRHRKKWSTKRKQRKSEIPNMMTDDSNELEAEKLDKLFPSAQDPVSPKRHSGRKSGRSSGRRKERRRKNRRRRLRQRKIKSSKSSVVVTHISNLPPLKERCKTRPMKQEIKVKGCVSKTITNNFCYGQCNSYYIPETQGRGDGPPAFVSCGFCRPRTVRPIIVQLRCTDRKGHARWRRKKVPYIKKCRCMDQQVETDFL